MNIIYEKDLCLYISYGENYVLRIDALCTYCELFHFKGVYYDYNLQDYICDIMYGSISSNIEIINKKTPIFSCKVEDLYNIFMRKIFISDEMYENAQLTINILWQKLNYLIIIDYEKNKSFYDKIAENINREYIRKDLVYTVLNNKL